MSTPPPSFGPTSLPPPGGGQPGGAGAAPPPWQGGGPPGGLTPGGSPPKKSRLPIVIAIVVVAAIAAVLIVVLTGDDDDDGGGAGVDAAAAHDGLQAIVDGSEDLQDIGVEFLSRCPFGRLNRLVDSVGEKLDLADDVSDADEVTILADVDGDIIAFCEQAVEDPAGGDGYGGVSFFAALDPPRSFEGFATNLFDDEEDEPDAEGEESYAGGAVLTYCNDTHCVSWWNDSENEIALAVGLEGEDVSPDDAVTALKLVLADLASELASNADEEPSDSEES